VYRVINASLPGPTVLDADVDSAASFFGYLYIVSQYTVRLMTPCVWRILCLRNSSSVRYFRQPPDLSTAARRNRKCTECGTTAVGRNRMSAESAHLSTFGTETEIEAEIRSTSLIIIIIIIIRIIILTWSAIIGSVQVRGKVLGTGAVIVQRYDRYMTVSSATA